MMYRLATFVIVLTFLLQVTSAPPVQAAGDNTLGVNLSELVDYSDEDQIGRAHV